MCEKFISAAFFLNLDKMFVVYFFIVVVSYLLFFSALFEFHCKEKDLLNNLPENFEISDNFSVFKRILFYFGLLYNVIFVLYFTSFIVSICIHH